MTHGPGNEETAESENAGAEKELVARDGGSSHCSSMVPGGFLTDFSRIRIDVRIVAIPHIKN